MVYFLKSCFHSKGKHSVLAEKITQKFNIFKFIISLTHVGGDTSIFILS